VHPDLKQLAQTLRDFIASENLYLITPIPSRWDSFVEILRQGERRILKRQTLQAVLAGALIALGIWFLYHPSYMMAGIGNPDRVGSLLANLIEDRLIRGPTTLNWFMLRLALQFVVGLLLMISATLLIIGKDRRGIALAYVGLLLALTTVNLLIFYFDQFSSIIGASVQLVVLLGVLHYRRNFL
jgi:hypothetical protein